GEQSRDFTYVANVVDATIRAAETPDANGRIFNVAAGAPATVNQVAETIGLILGKPVEKRFEPPRPGDIRDSWGDITAAREALGVGVLRIDELGREISPLRDLAATLRLARLIRRERPDILHTHTAKAGTVGRVAALLAGRKGPPIVVHTFHGHVLRGYFGPVRSLFFRLLERWLAGRTTALIAVSPQVRDDLVALHVAPPERFVVIRLGIELAERVDGAQ